MTINDHNKKIYEIWFEGDGNALNTRVSSSKERGIELELSAIYHGFHNEFWVLVKTNGIETERYNTRYLSNITWMQ